MTRLETNDSDRLNAAPPNAIVPPVDNASSTDTALPFVVNPWMTGWVCDDWTKGPERSGAKLSCSAKVALFFDHASVPAILCLASDTDGNHHSPSKLASSGIA